MRVMRHLGVLVLMLILLVGCASETPWRRVAVSTYEVLGMGIGETKSIGENLKAQGLVTDEQLARIKDAYNKARGVYIAAGNSLKLASSAIDVSSRDAFLAEYDRLLGDFKKLSYQVYELIKTFKKVSYLEVEEAIVTGGAI